MRTDEEILAEVRLRGMKFEAGSMRIELASRFMATLIEKQAPECPRCGLNRYDLPLMASRSLEIADALIEAALKPGGGR